MEITFAILTVSDSCYQKLKEDKSGPALEKCVAESFPNGRIITREIIPDEINIIEAELLELCAKKCNVILTTGGTGFSERDVTPEATRRVIKKEAAGISFAMISKSLQVTDMAMLSRAICGIRDQTLIINFPGSVKGASECFNFVKPSLVHAVQLLTNKQGEIEKVHKELQSSSASQVKVSEVAMRNRHSPYKMLEVEDALSLVLANCKSSNEIEVIRIEESLNRILAEDIHTTEPYPPFRASIKDGYAVKAQDGAGVRIVRDALAAGDDPESNQLKNGEVIRISTGAAVPSGADAVVQVEDTELIEFDENYREVKIKILIPPEIGQDIREIGSDISVGELVLCKFTKLKASHIGVLATIGKNEVSVFRRPSIGVLSTGNELQKHDEKLRPGHIRDSNKLTLLYLLIEYGYTGRDCGIARDEPNSVKESIEKAFEKHDVLITTGGVSMSEFDLIKEVLQEDFGAAIHFGRLNMKPGKPTTFSTCTYKNRRKFIFALPGNPVSATVTSLLFVIPAIRSLESQLPHLLPHISVVAGENVKLDSRPEYRRVKLERTNNKNNTFTAYSTGNQISSRLNSFVGAHALALFPSSSSYGSKILEKGEVLQAIIIDFN